ncbi:glutaminyl-peptide cyclotransferase [Oleiagrimonas sp.]|jgi:glutamine cyclotransferase|uniref:glutaminyl-peptide cyclotransferase n=1 Tax=Oleiagrimonas sp. TaxID=2010330 RepID=UPI002622019B|nr:glutaminyl-peptide cyclotransferase [Oleiagrimonas sp.]MDA3915279.1 glutaminyl-peptide cyclotransferase [Oleiagrimonas sp.]
MFRLVGTLALLAFAGTCWAAIPVYGYKVVHVYPHDTSAYTEGLFYRHGFIYESSGHFGTSTLRKVQLDTGKVVQLRHVPPQYFGEGIVAWKNRLIQLSWKSGTGFVYDLDSLKPLRHFSYSGEGWALTANSKHLFMSDGTPVLRILDPRTLRQTGQITVTADGVPVENLNELEWVKGEIYANVWLSNRIARIDPANGHVLGWIDLSGLLDTSRLQDPVNDVLNGIAYDARHNRLFVTGKCWPKLFQIRLVKRTAGRRN